MKLHKIKRLLKRYLFRKKENRNEGMSIGQYSTFIKSSDSILTNCNIILEGNSKLIIKDRTSIDNYDIYIKDGYLEIGPDCFFNRGRNSVKPRILIDNGSLIIDRNNVIRADFWIRFGGKCSLGIYNGICEETEIRCDERVSIGDYNMISYQCMIFDTNTHCIYSKERRREITTEDYPNIGKEFEKPKTTPVEISSDCWLGKRAVILKGTKLGECSVVGTNALISNCEVAANSIAIGNPAKILSK